MTIDPTRLNDMIEKITTITLGMPVDYVALAAITVAWGAAKDAMMSDVQARRELLHMIDFARDNSMDSRKIIGESNAKVQG